MGFVDHDQIPRNVAHEFGFVSSKGIGAKHNFVAIKRVGNALFDFFVERSRFEDLGRKIELVHQFLIPLLAKTRRQDDQDLPFAFSPFLRQDNSRFDGFAKSNFVGKDGSVGEWRTEGEECRVNLMRV